MFDLWGAHVRVSGISMQPVSAMGFQYTSSARQIPCNAQLVMLMQLLQCFGSRITESAFAFDEHSPSGVSIHRICEIK